METRSKARGGPPPVPTGGLPESPRPGRPPPKI